MQQKPVSTESLGVVIVGSGYFARFHINAWLRLTEVNLVAVVETDISKHKSLKARLDKQGYADTLITDSLAVALKHNTVNIVDIATPPSSHAGLINEASRLGSPLIICQKPFCDNYNTAKNIASQIQACNSTVVVHENFRFQPWYRAIKSEFAKNTLGTVLQATFRLRPGDGQGPDAYLERQPYFRDMQRFMIHETGVHYIDVFRYLFGEPQALSAELYRLNSAISGEDAGHFVFYYESGLRAHFNGNRLLDHAADNTRLTMGEMLIEGTQGSLALYGNGDLLLRNFGASDWHAIEYTFEDNDFGGDCVYHTQKHIIDHLQRGTALENRMDDYLRNLELEELIYKASAMQTRLECDV